MRDLKRISFIELGIKNRVTPYVYTFKVDGRYLKYLELVTETGSTAKVFITDMEGVPVGGDEYVELKKVLSEFIETEVLT
jgi:hypothetical protein